MLALLLAAPVNAAAEGNVELRERIVQLLANTRTATWTHDIWLTTGKASQHTIANVWWSSDGRIRVDVIGKDNAGSTAVLQGDKVIGFRRGILSFAKLSFDVNDKSVKSVRGQSMRNTGYFHHLRQIVETWDQVSFEPGAKGEVVIDFVNTEGHPTRLWLRTGDLQVPRIEVREEGKVVEKHAYTQIVYNAALPEGIFDP
jgi:outer membrane lipoprotein-sorting protein